MAEDDFREQSEFNMAISYLNRINYVIYLCNEAALNLDMYKWFHGLMALSRELSTEMKKTDKKDEIKAAEDHIKKIEGLMPGYIRKQTNETTKKLYDELHKFEMFLRNIIKKSGLQMKLKGDPRSALG